MQVKEKKVTGGIVAAAKELGVTYNYLWKVLTGRCESIPLVLKINNKMPQLFNTELCRIDWKSIVRSNGKRYVWDIDRYVRVKGA